jgi:uncharacterized protein (DUF1330 family)
MIEAQASGMTIKGRRRSCAVPVKPPESLQLMNTKFKITPATVAGATLGAASGLHAQAKLRAYTVTEVEVLDPAALGIYTPRILAAIKGAGGRTFNTAGGRTTAFTGEAPKRVGIIEWDSLEQAQAFVNSATFSNLATQRNKAEKYIRQFAVEATSN